MTAGGFTDAELEALGAAAGRLAGEHDRRVVAWWAQHKNDVCLVCLADLPEQKRGGNWGGLAYCGRECRPVVRAMAKKEALFLTALRTQADADWARYNAKVIGVEEMSKAARKTRKTRFPFAC